MKARNRYLNVQAWANSRIHLRVPEGECDFINASPIVLKDSSTDEETKYIATQVSVRRLWFLFLSADRQPGTEVGPPCTLLAHGVP